MMLDDLSSTQTTIELSALLVAGASIPASLEFVGARRELVTMAHLPRPLLIVAAQVLAAIGVIAAVLLGAGLEFALAALAATVWLLYFTQNHGTEGSDHIRMIVAVSLAIGVLTGAEEAALVFIALQAMLAYFAGGVAKAFGRDWRSGSAIPTILSTKLFGTPRLGAFLRRHATLGLALCWGTIAFECAFPLGVLAGGWVLLATLALAFAFHTAIAFTMGLTVFPWAFLATYPALTFVAANV